MPAGTGHRWLNEEIAARALARNDGDVEQAATALGLTPAEFRANLRNS